MKGIILAGGSGTRLYPLAPEKVAYYEKWITKEKLLKFTKLYGKCPYGEHLK